jgi:hypothetical protein
MEIHAPISLTNNDMPAAKDVYAANWDIYERLKTMLHLMYDFLMLCSTLGI